MTWRFGEVSFLNIHHLSTIFKHDLAEKLLQAVAALNRASCLNRDYPELHIRLIDLKQTGKLVSGHDLNIQLKFTLVSIFTTAVTSVFVDAVSKLVPDELSLDTFHSLRLQRHFTDP